MRFPRLPVIVLISDQTFKWQLLLKGNKVSLLSELNLLLLINVVQQMDDQA